MGARGFCNVEQNESDIQAFVLKKIITLVYSVINLS